jgi:hypothetical protein
MSDEIFISEQSLSLPKVQPEIQRLEAVWRERAAQRELTLTKPPGSLGQLKSAPEIEIVDETTKRSVNGCWPCSTTASPRPNIWSGSSSNLPLASSF